LYSEFSHFCRRVVSQKAVWTDGELWTAIGGATISYGWFVYDPSVIYRIRMHFEDLLNATSIVFGFGLAALLFYIQAAAEWSKNKNVARVAESIVDWHVWTIICLLILIGYILGLWSLGIYLRNESKITVSLYALLVFQLLYCGFQILNHTLTVWWSFRNRDKLQGK